ncbi:hypothetical protein ACN28C_01645 [Plantactinospora sp. WMMC1484]|uniref:hypothetical protein n=1 Tax=Plantactinospora sp. WMMC1484 TaxID=3404122 RepID=UPI003BF5FAE0
MVAYRHHEVVARLCLSMSGLAPTARAAVPRVCARLRLREQHVSPGHPRGAGPDDVGSSFDAEITPRPEALAIRYTLRNQGAEPIVGYVGVEGDAASHAYDVYVTARKDGTVELAKRTFAILPGVNADAVGTIEGTVVPPGEDVSEEFSVSLPLEGRRPYVATVTLPEPVRDVVFCLGVVMQSEAAAPKPARRRSREISAERATTSLLFAARDAVIGVRPADGWCTGCGRTAAESGGASPVRWGGSVRAKREVDGL